MAYKIKHKKTNKYLSTTASSRYSILYFCENPVYPLSKALVDNGRVYSTKRGAEKALSRLRSFKDEFEIIELK
jgi:hypothetical protein